MKKFILPNKEIIGIGRRSIFALASESLSKKSFSPEEVYDVILNLAKLKPNDSALASLDDEEPETVLLRLILLYVVMRKISAKEVRYKESTGTALGIFLSQEFW